MLQEALEIFERIGAPLWVERAAGSLQRVGGGAGKAGELTPTERRVAELAAGGMTNREVADALFLSVKSNGPTSHGCTRRSVSGPHRARSSMG